VCDGEQSRQHFVHGFLEQVEGIDFEHKVKMGMRRTLCCCSCRLINAYFTRTAWQSTLRPFLGCRAPPLPA
jgi:methionine synthase II (cobalamin-independent)